MSSHVRTLIDSARFLSLWTRLRFGRCTTAKSSGRHLALMTRALPPSTIAGVHRPLSFMRYGIELGWRISSFQAETPANQSEHGDELLALVPASVRRRVVPALPLQPAWRMTPRVDGGFRLALAFAQQAIDDLRTDPPSVLLASGPPFFSFIAAWYTARHFGVPLVIDYRDEWTECPFDFVSKDRHDCAWERRCLRDAAAVLFTTASMRAHQIAQFPELEARRAHVLPNGWEASDFETGCAPAEGAAEGRLTIAHVGNLAGHAAPDMFLNTLAQLLHDQPEWQQRLNLQMVGRRSREANAALAAFPFPELIECIDHVPKREANQRMAGSDALLLLAAPELERYFPSKLFDYLAARRPILVYGAEGEASAAVGKLQAGICCPAGDKLALLDALETLTAKRQPAPAALLDPWLIEHRRDLLAQRLFALLDTLQATTAQ